MDLEAAKEKINARFVYFLSLLKTSRFLSVAPLPLEPQNGLDREIVGVDRDKALLGRVSVVADLDGFLDLQVALGSARAPDELCVGKHGAEEVVIVVRRRELEFQFGLCERSQQRKMMLEIAGQLTFGLAAKVDRSQVLPFDFVVDCSVATSVELGRREREALRELGERESVRRTSIDRRWTSHSPSS